MLDRLRKYDKRDPHTYALGLFPAREALEACPEAVRALVTHPDAARSPAFADLLRCAEVNHIPVREEPRTLERIAAKENVFVAAVVEKRSRPWPEAGPTVVLIHPENMGNLGTIIRTMLGFAIQRLAIIEPAADLWDPRVVRASMGARFRVGIQTFPDFAALAAAIPGPLVAFTGSADATLGETRLPAEATLVFGPESAGLPDDILAACQQRIKIPQPGPIDSFNLAVSVAISCYELRRPVVQEA